MSSQASMGGPVSHASAPRDTPAVPVSLHFLAAALALLGLGGVAAAAGGTRTWDFQGDAVGAAPAGFTFVRTGQGSPGRWEVRLDPSAPAGDHVLTQVEGDATDSRFPVAVADASALKDVRLEVRCKQLSGNVDQACGLVVRFRDADDYYVTRANALEDNVRLYRVVQGRREQLASWSGKVAPGVWHSLALEARGDKLRVLWEGKAVIEAADETFAEAGKVGVWTKADSVTSYDALTVTPLADGPTEFPKGTATPATR